MSRKTLWSSDSGDSINWRLIRDNLARRELTGTSLAEIEHVSVTDDGQVVVSGKDTTGTAARYETETNTALQRMAKVASQTSQQIQGLYDQAEQQALFWFKASAVTAVLGFVLVVGGIIEVVFFHQTAFAIFSSVCGLLFEATATLFFRQSTEANKRLDGYREDLLDAKAIYEAIELSKTSERSDIRDRLTEVIIKKLLGIEVTAQEQGSEAQDDRHSS